MDGEVGSEEQKLTVFLAISKDSNVCEDCDLIRVDVETRSVASRRVYRQGTSQNAVSRSAVVATLNMVHTAEHVPFFKDQTDGATAT